MRPGPVAPVLVLGALVLSGCSSSSAAAGRADAPASPAPVATRAAPDDRGVPAPEPVESGAPPRLTGARLLDRVEARPPGDRVRSTTWEACFRPGRSGPVRLEAQPLTTEGAGTRLRPLEGRCLALVVATADDTRAGRASRAEQLFTSGALAYRVRSVHGDGSASAWSEPVRVGAVRAAGATRDVRPRR